MTSPGAMAEPLEAMNRSEPVLNRASVAGGSWMRRGMVGTTIRPSA